MRHSLCCANWGMNRVVGKAGAEEWVRPFGGVGQGQAEDIHLWE